MSRWIAVHRHDIPVDSPLWDRFGGILHNGYHRQLRVNRNRKSHLQVWAYVYPAAVYKWERVQNGARATTPSDFAGYGNLLESLEYGKLSQYALQGVAYRDTQPHHRPTSQRAMYWIDWTQAIEIALATIPATHSQSLTQIDFWFVDLIPDWYRAFEIRGQGSLWQTQVEALIKLLKNLRDVPVIGNVYQGGEFLSLWNSIADGAYFENWLWHWSNGARLSGSVRDRIQSQVQATLQAGKRGVLNVPYLPPSEVEFALTEMRAIVEQHPDLFFSEQKNWTNQRSYLAPSTIRV